MAYTIDKKITENSNNIVNFDKCVYVIKYIVNIISV
jgi:hypothetical protein